MVDKSIKLVITAVAASVVVKSLPRSETGRGSRTAGSVGRHLSEAVADTMCRGVWNAAYAAWRIMILGQRAQARF